MYIGWFKLQLPNGEEMGEDQAVLMEGLWRFISVCEVISQNNIESIIIGMDVTPENGKILCVLVLETILRYVIIENSRAEKIKTILGNLLYLKKARGSLIRVEF